MTLNTYVYALTEVDPHETFHHCRDLIGAGAQHAYTDTQDRTWRAGVGAVEPANPWTIGNKIGQGLCALLDVRYQPGVPLRPESQVPLHDEGICNLPGTAWYDPEQGPCDGADHELAHWLKVSFDTAYGYRGDDGSSCGDLHARLVGQPGRWFDAQHVPWRWRNEYTGEVHEGYERLVELCTDGFASRAWLMTAVLPAIPHEIGGA